VTARAGSVPGNTAADTAPADYLESIPRKSTRTTDFLVELNMRLSRDIRY